MNWSRRHLLRLAVALLAIQATAFVVPAAVGRRASCSAGSCTCCRLGSPNGCPMCRRAAAATDRCTCRIGAARDAELPWLFGITGVLPIGSLPLAPPDWTCGLAVVRSTADSFHSAPPIPPPRGPAHRLTRG